MLNWCFPHPCPGRTFRSWGALLILGGALLPCVRGATWKVQLNYDQDNSSLEIIDLQCPSVNECVAAGVIVDTSGGKDKAKGTVVLTSDGGAHWSYEEAHEIPLSLFFLNDTTGWMVTEKGIWQSTEAGHNWKKLKAIKGLQQVWFLNPSHGFAVGGPKVIMETNDGGKEWARLPASDLSLYPPELVSYESIAFSGPHGWITGSVAPESANSRRGPASEILLQTSDSGKTWRLTKLGLRGRIGCLRLRNEPASALLLIEYFGKASFPSELYSIDTSDQTSKALFEQKDKVARDVAVLPNGEVIVAAVERMGELSEVPIPSKLKMMHSTSLDTWLDESADYRAVAMRPVLAFADSNHVWVATDTGMILKRTE